MPKSSPESVPTGVFPRGNFPAADSRAAQRSDTPLKLVTTDGRDAQIVAFEETVVCFFVEAASLLGIPRSVAAIYGICFASTQPLGYSELNDRLEISSGSISQGIRVLREIGALKVVTTRFEKRERFEPDLELRKLVSHFIEQRLEKQLQAGKGRLRAMHDAVPPGEDGSVRLLTLRIKSLQAWHKKSQAVLPVIKKFLQLV